MEKDELRARLDDIMGNASAPSIDSLPDTPRYSLMTAYPEGVFKASDLYLWLDRLLKISRVRTIRESPAGFAGARVQAVGVSTPDTAKRETVAEAIKRKKAEKIAAEPAKAPAAPKAMENPKEMAKEAPAKPEEAKAPVAEPEEMEIEGPAKSEEAEIEREAPEEFEVESKGVIKAQISIEDIKKGEDEEMAKKPPAEKGVGIPYLDSHVAPKVELPEILNLDPDSKSMNDIGNISESVKSDAYQDKLEITKRLLELTKLKIREKSLENKKKIDSEIMLLKDRMKAGKAQTASDLPAMVSSHFSSELESVLEGLELSIDSSIGGLKARYEAAKASASGDSALLARIDTQFIKDSNALAEETSGAIERSRSFLIDLHTREADAAAAKGIFTNEKAALEKSMISKDYPPRFNALMSKAELIARGRQEAVSKSSFAETIKEITAMKEAELLHELSARDRKTFLSYIKGELSKTDAIIMSKRAVAKEREVPQDAIDQFFPKGGNA